MPLCRCRCHAADGGPEKYKIRIKRQFLLEFSTSLGRNHGRVLLCRPREDRPPHAQDGCHHRPRGAVERDGQRARPALADGWSVEYPSYRLSLSPMPVRLHRALWAADRGVNERRSGPGHYRRAVPERRCVKRVVFAGNGSLTVAALVAQPASHAQSEAVI